MSKFGFKISIKSLLSSINFAINFFKKNSQNNIGISQATSSDLEEKEKVSESRIQENLPFSSKNHESIKNKFKLPSLDFLKYPTKKEKNNLSNTIDADTLEKI